MVDLHDLERELSTLSHGEQALSKVQFFCAGLKNTEARVKVWNANNAIVQKPIEREFVRESGFDTPDDDFLLLQGDVVRTDSAFAFGERITGQPKYAVLNSSCDLVPGRSKAAMLLRVVDIKRNDPTSNEKLSQLLKFTRRDSMYMPPLPGDPDDVAGSVLHFDEVCQIKTQDLFLATRVASLSLIGWRIFATFARVVVARSTDREVAIRTAVDGRGRVAA